MSLFAKLCAIAEKYKPMGYLKAYEADLTTHDFNQLALAPDDARFIWILRSTGTELFQIAAGRDPAWATYWLEDGHSIDAPNLAYLLDSATDTVKPITYAEARELANIAPADGVWRKKFCLS